MLIDYHKSFQKSYNKLELRIKRKFNQRLELFTKDQFHSVLNNHKLHGKYEGFRSINITGDIRAIYFINKEDTVIFITIGSHNKLYE